MMDYHKNQTETKNKQLQTSQTQLTWAIEVFTKNIADIREHVVP